MARPLSEEKRIALLTAAAEAVAIFGTSAPTAKIASAAGMAEGTLFSYFKTKDALLNELYLAIKKELSESALNDCWIAGSLIAGWQLVWDRYIDWGDANSAKRKALRQLSVSTIISTASRKSAAKMTGDVTALLEESLKAAILRPASPEFVIGTLLALAEMTLDFIAHEPKRRSHYKKAGFETLWNAIARKQL